MTYISPMLLESCEEPFNDDRYIFEPQIDGHRLVLDHRGGETRLFTRHKNEVTQQYPELWHVPLNGDVTLDVKCAV